MKQIEFERWEPDAENPRRLTYAGQRTAEDVFHELEAQLDSVGYLPDEYRYTKPENLSPKMKIFSKIPQRCLKTTSASAHRNRLSSRSAALLTQKHSHRLRRWLCFFMFFQRSSRKYGRPREAGGCFSLLLRMLEMTSTMTVTRYGRIL